MAGDEELSARAALDEMQSRISQGPYAALGLDGAAAAEDVRAAFLALTKQFHPARFGRMSNELQRYANEVFLGIKAAHDLLQKSLGGIVRGPHQSGSLPTMSAEGSARMPAPQLIRRTSQLAAIERPATGQIPALARPSGPLPETPSQFARGTDRPTGTRPAVTPAPSMPTPNQGFRAITPNSAPGGGQRPSSPAVGAPASRAPSPPAGPRTTPAQGFPVQRPTTPVGARPGTPSLRPTTPGGRAHSPSSPPPNAPPRPSTDLNPPTIRGVQPASAASSQSIPKLGGAAAFDERSALRECMMLLNDRKWSDARQALHTLASKVPQSKSYRALLCYARGREAHAAGRADEAQLEYQRALQLEPELDLAKQAIAELGRRR